jgi:3D (Asp-Asp-Asp) domain-containing protein
VLPRRGNGKIVYAFGVRWLALVLLAPALASADPGPGPGLGRFVFTFYWIAEEREVPARPQTYVYDSRCLPVAAVSLKFLRQLAMEGTGLLSDGRLLNFDARCLCSWEGVACFKEVTDERRWGIGVDDRPLQPFRSVAVDNNVIATGTRLYVPDLEGLVMPGAPPWGGFVHDGCVVADDRGGAIDGQQLDFFVGTKGSYKMLDRDLHRPSVRVYDGGDRCR